MDLHTAEAALAGQHIDAWLIYDFRGNNPIFAEFLPGKRFTTRRAMLLVASGREPLLLHHGIDGPAFADVTIPCERYLTWRDLHRWLESALSGRRRVAMEYAPGGALPVIGIVDAGTVELVRSIGVEVVSSANLVQATVARWSDAAVANHRMASEKVARIKDRAFALIGQRLAAGQRVLEHEIAEFIRQQFAGDGLEWPDGPIVAANAHSGDPHFEPSAEQATEIRKGDWVLLDLWARAPGVENIFSDITWVGFAGETPGEAHRRVFEVVKQARDACLARAVDGWRQRERVQGWRLDDAARDVIIAAGYGDAVRHRTGHSLSPGPKVHGLGVNLDNLETHDTRELMPGVGFTIEPGVYLPEFGVRLEINVFVDPAKGPVVTSCVQDEIVRI